MTTRAAEAALERFLGSLDAERWDDAAAMLADDVELADELTSGWLRGRDRVAAYLQAQRGVITNITSEAADVASRRLGDDETMLTFGLRQTYDLDGETRHERLLCCAAFREEDGEWLLTLLHFGESARAGTDGHAVPSEPSGRTGTLGLRVRARRKAAGLSLRALAARSGLSPSFLSQLERSLVDPSVESLSALAGALDTTSADLLGGEPADGVTVSRRRERGVARLAELGMNVESLPGAAGGRLALWLTELEPDGPSFEPRVAGGVERVVYVLAGALEVVGERTVLLGTGDSVRLAGGWRFRAARGEPARFLTAQLQEDT
jgi:transcriptional regulator with XRE-family HTH domain